MKKLLLTSAVFAALSIGFTSCEKEEDENQTGNEVLIIDDITTVTTWTSDKVYVIDEIERSIHPMTIKEIMTKLALDENVKGQLIFSTHESNLLDQSIFRPDEIWFAQKDFDGSSKI